MKLKEYNQMMAYLTRPRDSLRKIIKKKPVDPVKIDFSGINRDINVYENAIKADPIKPQKREEKLEGLAAILGVDSKKI